MTHHQVRFYANCRDAIYRVRKKKPDWFSVNLLKETSQVFLVSEKKTQHFP